MICQYLHQIRFSFYFPKAFAWMRSNLSFCALTSLGWNMVLVCWQAFVTKRNRCISSSVSLKILIPLNDRARKREMQCQDMSVRSTCALFPCGAVLFRSFGVKCAGVGERLREDRAWIFLIVSCRPSA